MKKCLRKKFHIGEFQEFGFEIACYFVSSFSDEALDRFSDDFIAEAIARNGLQFGGGGKENEWSGFVTLARRGSATDEHRTKVSEWLKSRADIKDYKIGKLIDAWYGYE